MQGLINQFSYRQYMEGNTMEFFHYKGDLSYGRVKPHTHTHYEFYFFLAGDAFYTVGNKRFHLEPGDFLIIEPEKLHFPEIAFSKGTNRPYERVVIWVSPDYLKELEAVSQTMQSIMQSVAKNGSCHYRPGAEARQRIVSILEEMTHEQEEQGTDYEFYMGTLFSQLLIQINRILHTRKTVQKNSPTRNLYSEVVRYIHNNIEKPLSLDDLASEFYVSRSYISRVFREHLDISVHQYVLRLKLDRALDNIAGGASLSEAAMNYGFENYSTFYRLCRKEFNLSPRQLVNRIHADQLSADQAQQTSHTP